MASLALICPQCGGPLPRQAMWRMVTCPHCRAVVTRSADVVQRGPFRDALRRQRDAARTSGRRLVEAGTQAYAVVAVLGHGRASTVLLAERAGSPVPGRVVLKLARDGDAMKRLADEARRLEALQALDAADAHVGSMRLPQPLFHGAATDSDGGAGSALVLRHVDGVWGSLAAVHAVRTEGIDPRHAVWIWRRGLETLAYVHRAGWTHGDVGLEHLLVHPAAHAVFVVGWADAEAGSGATFERRRARDLRQLAWCIRALLQGSAAGADGLPAQVPAPLAELLRHASDDDTWPHAGSAEAIERALVAAAAAAFGAPRFVAFDPLAHAGLGAATRAH